MYNGVKEMNIVKNRKLICVMVLMLILTSFISGCGAKSAGPYNLSSSESDFAGREEKGYDSSMPEDSDFTDFSPEDSSREPDKIITTISINMQTKEFMETTDKLNSLIKKYKGYIEQSNISYNNYVYSSRLKYSDYNIRIPRENIDSFVNELKAIGNIISENKNKQDITKQYRDTESRLRVLETKEDRILELLKRAEKMEDIISLENQLSNIIYDKESLTANIMDMDDKVDYGTIVFQLEEVAKLTSSGNIQTSFLDKIKNAINDSIYFFGNSVESLIISFIYFSPYLLIILIIIFVVYRFIRRRKNRLPKNWEDISLNRDGDKNKNRDKDK